RQGARDVAGCSAAALDARPPIHDRRSRLVSAAVVHVPDDSDDLVPLAYASDTNALAERGRRLAPPLPRHVLRDDGHLAIVEDIGPREVAAREERRPERREETRRNILGAPQRRNAFRVG